jgi:hypothetical protein
VGIGEVIKVKAGDEAAEAEAIIGDEEEEEEGPAAAAARTGLVAAVKALAAPKRSRLFKED